ncbi:MAG: hypothetical protein J5700_00130, partial [Treponema sp.]|nr:hypothetical protein [Treponema sp.]
CALFYDNNSHKKMRDSQAALFIADKLASQIENESGRAMDQLFNSLQSQTERADVNDVQAKKEAEQNWLARFENELNLGLKKWSDAEEEFLSARSEWEREAENVYLNDNQKWQEAYDELQNRKIAWSQKIEAQIQEGKLEWRNKLDVLEKEIDQSLREFQSALLWENEQKRQIVQSQEEAYAQSRAILETAQKGVDIWYERWGEKYKGLYSYWKTEDNHFGKTIDISLVGTSNLRNQILSWKDSLANILNSRYRDASRKSYDSLQRRIQEAMQNPNDPANKSSWILEDAGKTYFELYPQLECSRNSSGEKIKEAVRKLSGLKYYVGNSSEAWDWMNNALDMWNAASEILSWLDLYDSFERRAGEALCSLYSDSCANIQIVDELSSEKAKALWLVDYWSCRADIAAAVVKYAQNDFSDLEWAQETERNLSAAVERYQKAKQEYQDAFEFAKEKRLDVLTERDQYYEALAASQELLQRIEVERQAYDKLYQAKVEILDKMAGDSSLELLFDLQSLNYQSEDFKKYLWRYCSDAQEDFDQKFEEQ